MTALPGDPRRRHFLRAGTLCSLGAGLAAALPAAAARMPPSPLARVRGGRIAGQTEHGIHVFRGIPYGADTAPRRFQQAVQEAPWRGVRDALAWGPAAPQTSGRKPAEASTGEGAFFSTS